MNILILGGTGAMGIHVVNLLAEKGHDLTVTSRSVHESSEHIQYIQGNAKKLDFIQGLLKDKYDAIVDFMTYNTKDFTERYQLFLDATSHYIHFSSARVFAESKEPIIETSPRLLDVCQDEEYLKTDEYALTKAKQENLLRESGKTNWTTIRPYITYNDNRLQLGTLEKEYWLYRAMRGKAIVFSKDVLEKRTTMTYGYDVARVIAELVGNEKAYGEFFNITTSETKTWGEILEIYLNVIEEKTGKKPKVHLLEDSYNIQKLLKKYQIVYDRLYNREFDSSKVLKACDVPIQFKGIEEGLRECLKELIDREKEYPITSLKWETYLDKITKEATSLHEIHDLKAKVRYLYRRYFPFYYYGKLKLKKY